MGENITITVLLEQVHKLKRSEIEEHVNYLCEKGLAYKKTGQMKEYEKNDELISFLCELMEIKPHDLSSKELYLKDQKNTPEIETKEEQSKRLLDNQRTADEYLKRFTRPIKKQPGT